MYFLAIIGMKIIRLSLKKNESSKQEIRHYKGEVSYKFDLFLSSNNRNGNDKHNGIKKNKLHRKYR